MILNKRIDSLQSLRALGFIAVCIHRVIPDNVGSIGPCAVSIFFVLSGFFSYVKHKEKVSKPSIINNYKYAWSRIKSLYPLHIITMILMLYFQAQILVDNFQLKTLFAKIMNTFFEIFMVKTFIPHSGFYLALHPITWYLCTLFFLYFMFPSICIYERKIENNKNCILYITAIIFIQIILVSIIKNIEIVSLPKIGIELSDNLSSWFSYVFPLFRFGDFIVGTLVGYLYLNYDNKISKTRATFLEIVVVIIVILLNVFIEEYNKYIGISNFDNFKYTTIVFLISSSLLVYLFAINKGLISKFLSNKVLVRIGNISAYGYILHFVVYSYIVLLFDLLNLKINYFEILIYTLIITLLLSDIIYNTKRRKLNNEKN